MLKCGVGLVLSLPHTCQGFGSLKNGVQVQVGLRVEKKPVGVGLPKPGRQEKKRRKTKKNSREPVK